MIKKIDDLYRSIKLNKINRVIKVVYFIVFIVVLVKNTWVADDSFITYRTMYNFLNGHGLRWNTIERVQTYTHPLWLFVLIPSYVILKNIWLSAVATSLLCMTTMIVLLYNKTADKILFLLSFLLLICSRSFIDFSISGLENPLSYLLFLLVFITSVDDEENRKVEKISFLSALLVLNRFDHILIVFPLLLYYLFRKSFFSQLGKVVKGFSPLLMWFLFSFLYYGFIFPNSFYAKLKTGWPRDEILMQGIQYFIDSFKSDYITLPVLIAVFFMLLIFHKRSLKLIMWYVGIGIYLVYVLWIGGDFMSGRFFSSIFFISILVLSRMQLPKYYLYSLFIFPLISILHPYNPLYTNREFYEDRKGNEKEIYKHGIVDEKGMSWWRSGFNNIYWESEIINLESHIEKYKINGERKVQVEVAVGYRGYKYGPNIHIVDQLAITDPLLARLPAERRKDWRIGHFFRKIPDGYLASITRNRNLIEDEDLSIYYEKLKLITQGEIFDFNRIKEILLFNLGFYDHLINKTFYEREN